MDAPDPRGLPVPRRTVQQSTASSAAALDLAEEPMDGGVFALFPGGKKCDDWAAVERGTGVALELVHAGGL